MKNLPLQTAALLALSFSSAHALDTFNHYDHGLSFFLYQAGSTGLEIDDEEDETGSSYHSLTLGMGIFQYLGASITLRHGTDNNLTGSRRDAQLVTDVTLISNLVETTHFDFDLLGGTSIADGHFATRLSFEINVDQNNDQSGVGFFLKGGGTGFIIDDRAKDGTIKMNDKGEEKHKRAWNIDLTPAAYLTLAKRHQILAGIDLSYASDPLPGKDEFTLGSAHLGYNVTIFPKFELLIDFGYHIDDETFSSNVGIIAIL